MIQRMPKMTQVKNTTKKITQFVNDIKSIRDKLALCEIMLAAGNLEGAYHVLVKPDETTDLKKSAAINYAKIVYNLIEEKKKEIEENQEKIIVFEEKKKVYEEELRQYDKQTIKTTKMLKDLAESKFNTIVDIQLLLSRANRNVKSTNIENIMTSRLKKFLNKYSAIIKAFTNDKMTKKRSQSSLRDSDDNRSHGPLMSMVGGSFRDAEDSAEQTLEGEFLMVTEVEIEESFLNDDVIVDFDSENVDDNFSMTTDEGPNITTAMSVDEVISLAHYNSNYSRLKREEEARILEEAQKLAIDGKNLQMQIFDQYWSALPPREENMIETLFNKKPKKKNEKENNETESKDFEKDGVLSQESISPSVRTKEQFSPIKVFLCINRYLTNISYFVSE